MKIYNGIRYLSFGFGSLKETERHRIENIFRPFSFINCQYPIIIKSWIWNPKVGDHNWYDEYNPKMIDWLSSQIDIRREKNIEGDLVLKCYSNDGEYLGDPEMVYRTLKG